MGNLDFTEGCNSIGNHSWVWITEQSLEGGDHSLLLHQLAIDIVQLQQMKLKTWATKVEIQIVVWSELVTFATAMAAVLRTYGSSSCEQKPLERNASCAATLAPCSRPAHEELVSTSTL